VPLGVKERGVRALAGRELLNVIAHQPLEQARVVAAFHPEFAAKRKIEKPGGGAHGAILRRGISESSGNDRPVIFPERSALRDVIFIKRRAGHCRLMIVDCSNCRFSIVDCRLRSLPMDD
jgi:hypothetical protein